MKQQSNVLRRNSAERVEPLSILPVFLELNGKHAIVIGGAGPAIWKAELLAKAGARVKLICKAPSAEVLQFVSNIQSPSAISLSIANWRHEDISGAEVIVADVEETEAAELFATAKKYTSMVNIIDKPAYCTFQFGSIVNKSPLVIGISTSGAAPVLAQHVRSLLEASLPADIQSLVKRAARIRGRVNERLETNGNRRSYWGAFFGHAFGFRFAPKAFSTQRHMIKINSIEDLTLRDLRALQSADRIYFQSGVDQRILQFARREADRIQMDDESSIDHRFIDGGNSVVVYGSDCSGLRNRSADSDL